jgi:chromosomal replication initiator protein
MQEFREKYRKADLLLVDDIQFIAGKDSTQEEFFHTFNTLYEAKHQIVLTSDRPPKAMNTLEDRLKTRFEWGLISEINPPDYETRMAIIKNKAQQLGIILPEDIMVYIAENITSNVRQIEGAVKKIMAYRDLMGSNISISSVAQVLKELYTEKSEFAPTADIIIEETARYYSVSPESIKGSKQTRDIVVPRHVSIYLIREMTNLSLTDIGDIFNRHHATVKNSLNWIEDNMKTSPELSNVIKDIKANINSRS